ncbi:hypothetical protein DPMN_055801 [Dreissena polymorpha]|uniref:Uncharacterized protein n=1 Tax=Dreissena polymorpha TaxID=45954 RepID=A0A9D4HUF2_DREPO|nr:hypothetical protein DPMN_055801 [Dreissena polymorpha]
MTPIDFQVTSTKVKVTVTKVVFTQWLPVQRTAHMWGMHVLQTALVSIDFSKTHQWIIDIQDPTVDIIVLTGIEATIQESEPLMIQQASVNCADQMQSTGFTLVLSESMSTADSEEPGSLTHDRREPSEEPASLSHDRRSQVKSQPV